MDKDLRGSNIVICCLPFKVSAARFSGSCGADQIIRGDVRP
jgi:hypothetical protein